MTPVSLRVKCRGLTVATRHQTILFQLNPLPMPLRPLISCLPLPLSSPAAHLLAVLGRHPPQGLCRVCSYSLECRSPSACMLQFISSLPSYSTVIFSVRPALTSLVQNTLLMMVPILIFPQTTYYLLIYLTLGLPLCFYCLAPLLFPPSHVSSNKAGIFVFVH